MICGRIINSSSLSEVVPDFRTAQQLRSLFELAAHCLAPGGTLGVQRLPGAHGLRHPTDAAREFGQQMYTGMCSRPDMATAAAGLPLELVADDSVYEYEKAHLPPGGWPPTSWYADWIRGFDVFTTTSENCPIEMRWLVFRKTQLSRARSAPAAAGRSPRPAAWPTGIRAW